MTRTTPATETVSASWIHVPWRAYYLRWSAIHAKSTRFLGPRLSVSPHHDRSKLTIFENPEQPDASTSNANTAPQEPKPDGQSLTSVPQQAASSTSDRPSATPTTDMGSTTATGSSNTAAAGLSNSTVNTNTGTKADDGKKQRDTDNTHVDENAQKQVHQGRRGTAAIMEDHGVSRETLKGPQGPAPHPAADFEKEGQKETKDEQPAGSSRSLAFLV